MIVCVCVCVCVRGNPVQCMDSGMDSGMWFLMKIPIQCLCAWVGSCSHAYVLACAWCVRDCVCLGLLSVIVYVRACMCLCMLAYLCVYVFWCAWA